MSIKMFNNRTAGKGMIYPPSRHECHFVVFIESIQGNVKKKLKEFFREFFLAHPQF
jgi:hypothetical protein